MSTKKFTLMALILCLISFLLPITYTSYKNSKIPKIYDDFSQILEEKDTRLIIFSLSSCPICTAVKEVLDEKNINYYEVDVKKDKNHPLINTYKRFNTKKVPVIILKDYGQVGYSQDIFSELED